MTALRKKGGRVRGIVVGDVIRRLTARTIAKQLGTKSRRGQCSVPVCVAFSTRSGCEVVHVLQAFTELDPETTITSIDGG